MAMNSLFMAVIAGGILFVLVIGNNDQGNIFYDEIDFNLVNEFTKIKFRLLPETRQNWRIESCTYCSNKQDGQVQCTSGEMINLELQHKTNNYKVPLNVSCNINNKNGNTIIILNTISHANYIYLFWSSMKGINKYSVCLMYNNKYSCHIKITGSAFLKFDKMKDKTNYYICIASIDNNWQTSPYNCTHATTDFSISRSILDMQHQSYTDHILLSWKNVTRSLSIAESYIVSYTSTGEDCQLIIIQNMVYNDSRRSQCPSNTVEMLPDHHMRLQHLPPHTRYNISVIFVINNKKYIGSAISVMTKEAKSGPVSSLSVTRKGQYVQVHFNEPRTPNGIITKYFINITLQSIDICPTSKRWINGTFVTSTDYIINMDHCDRGTYLIEVTPFNGWSNDDGQGEIASVTYTHTSDISQSNKTVKVQFVSNNLLQISLIKYLADKCGSLAFVIEIDNTTRDCSTIIMTRDNCDALNNTIHDKFKCTNKRFVKYDEGNMTTPQFVSGSYGRDKSVSVKIWKINHEIELVRSFLLIQEISDCFTDCRDSRYIGIRSATKSSQVCKLWSQTVYSNYISNYCACDTQYCWCYSMSGGNYEECDIPTCSQINAVTSCVTTMDHSTSTSSATVKWSAPNYQAPIIIGYMTLLHNTSNLCERSHIQIINGSQSEGSLNNRVNNFYLSCQSKSIDQNVTHQTIFSDLHQNTSYIVYVIPIISNDDVGEVRKLHITTKLACPSPPRNLQIKYKSTYSLQFVWDKSIVTNQHGAAERYRARLINMINNSYIDKVLHNEEAIFEDLNQCTKYCLHLTAENQAGTNSIDNQRTCSYTMSSNIDKVVIYDVQSNELNHKYLSWKYLRSSLCISNYRVEYRVKYTNEEVTVNTRENRIRVDNWRRNVIYMIEVRAETNLITENGDTIGPYSEMREFYNGPMQPRLLSSSIRQHNEILNISWSLEEEFVDSVFGFVIRVVNESGSCLHSVNMECKDCIDPYEMTNLDHVYLTRINNLTGCEKKNYSFYRTNRTLFQTIHLPVNNNNYSIEMYSVNLMGVQPLYKGRLTVSDMQYSHNAKNNAKLDTHLTVTLDKRFKKITFLDSQGKLFRGKATIRKERNNLMIREIEKLKNTINDLKKRFLDLELQFAEPHVVDVQIVNGVR